MMSSVTSVSSIPRLEKNKAGRWSLMVDDRLFATLMGYLADVIAD